MTPSVWIFVLWLLVPGQPALVKVTGQGDTEALCQVQLKAHLFGAAKLSDASKCVEITPWLHVIDDE